jgi:hypothetical protein
MGIRERLFSGTIKTALYFERLYPRYIKYFIGRSLKGLKERDMISDYKVKAVGRRDIIMSSRSICIKTSGMKVKMHE